MGRPTKLTEDFIETVCQLVENGTHPDTAARMYGVSERTMDDWLKKGREDEARGMRKESLHLRFLRRLDKSKAKAEAVLVAQVRLASQGSDRKPGDWKAAAWLLAKLNPTRFAEKNNIHLLMKGRMTHDGAVDVNVLTDEEIAARLAEIDARQAEIEAAKSRKEAEAARVKALAEKRAAEKVLAAQQALGRDGAEEEPEEVNLATVDADEAWYDETARLPHDDREALFSNDEDAMRRFHRIADQRAREKRRKEAESGDEWLAKHAPSEAGSRI